ncbi:MAG TPA: hypothetical protein VK475_03880 [Pyrinomonadaceae bacterium]|nr:hypothetical protein [Pyrinomonadaceae bacterium]
MHDNKKYLVEVSIRAVAVRPTDEGVYQNRLDQIETSGNGLTS